MANDASQVGQRVRPYPGLMGLVLLGGAMVVLGFGSVALLIGLSPESVPATTAPDEVRLHIQEDGLVFGLLFAALLVIGGLGALTVVAGIIARLASRGTYPVGKKPHAAVWLVIPLVLASLTLLLLAPGLVSWMRVSQARAERGRQRAALIAQQEAQLQSLRDRQQKEVDLRLAKLSEAINTLGEAKGDAMSRALHVLETERLGLNDAPPELKQKLATTLERRRKEIIGTGPGHFLMLRIYEVIDPSKVEELRKDWEANRVDYLDVNSEHMHGVMLEAARVGDAGIIKRGLERGFDPMMTGPRDERSLFAGAAEGVSGEVLELVLQRGISPDTPLSGGRFAVDVICEVYGDERAGTLRVLLKHGANPNRRDRDGRAPLHIVIPKRNAMLMEALVEGGADVNALDKEGRTPLDLAETRGGRHRKQMLEVLARKSAKPGKDVAATQAAKP